VEIPLDRFVLTWKGGIVDSPVEMNRQRICGFGISLAGGDLQSPGPFRLGLDWVKASRKDDADVMVGLESRAHGKFAKIGFF
jgi:Complex I intermediate-associated protein 30 (CIA30)